MIATRGLLIAGALIASYLGLTRGWLSLQCREPIDLADGAGLASARSSPFRATTLAQTAATGLLVLTSDSGTSQAAWVVLVAPREPQTAVAVAVTTLDHARKLQSMARPVRIEGMARLPTRTEGKRIRALCEEAHLVPSPGFRMLEAGGQPPALAGCAALMVLGGGFLYAARRLRRPAFWRQDAWSAAKEEETILVPAPGASPPLPEEVKLELQHMVREVWEAAT